MNAPLQGPTLIVAATHRSGSYHLCDLLSKFADIPLPEEHFNFDLLYTRSRLGFSDEAPVREVMAALREEISSDQGIFTMKAMWGAFSRIFRTLARESDGDPAAWQALPMELFPGARFIFIRRRDKVRQAVSFYKASLTGVWRHESAEKRYPPEFLVYDYLKILKHLRTIEADERGWEAFLTSKGLPYKEVWYEDFVKDRLSGLREICDFLEIPPRMDHVPDVRFVRAPDDINSKWASLYEGHAEAVRLTSQADGLLLEADSACRVEFVEEGGSPGLAGEKGLLHFKVTNTGNRPWPVVGVEDGPGWIRLCVQLGKKDETDSSWVGLYCQLGPGESTNVAVPLTFPSAAGRVTGIVHVEQEGVGPLCPEKTLSFIVGETPVVAGLNRHFPGWEPTDVREWKKLPGLGKVKVDLFPWIYHPEHGWLFVAKESSQTGGVTIHDKQVGWLQVYPESYPSGIVRVSDWTSLNYKGMDGEMRVFELPDSGKEIRVPKNPGGED